PILGVAIGTVFTLVVQSSSATIGILQGLFCNAACKSTAPSENNPCKIQIVALELCTTNVKTVPIATPKIGLSLILNVNSWKTCKFRKGCIPLLIKLNPKNNEPKP